MLFESSEVCTKFTTASADLAPIVQNLDDVASGAVTSTGSATTRHPPVLFCVSPGCFVSLECPGVNAVRSGGLICRFISQPHRWRRSKSNDSLFPDPYNVHSALPAHHKHTVDSVTRLEDLLAAYSCRPHISGIRRRNLCFLQLEHNLCLFCRV